MSTESDFRLPYGPGWEDADWQPHAPAAQAGPGTLADYMGVVRRHAPRKAANAPRMPARKQARASAPLLDPARRRMVAGGACMLAVGSLLLPGATRRPPEVLAEAQPAAASELGADPADS